MNPPTVTADPPTADPGYLRLHGRRYRLVPIDDDPPAEAAMHQMAPQPMIGRPRNWVLIGLRTRIVERAGNYGPEAMKIQDILDDLGDGKIWQMFLELGVELLIKRIRELLEEVS